ncbi:hypothetical protein [Arenimonas donghaensis]|uniref:Lipoprotein n=1 Tax=Arenimonas donghaensis DSM 18148 = HO3-R19 TaxID=1121014 RepID=A0A087MLK0_9GAMM|nr:hypothetical protein [Arenimonas donghaensis]KFL37753.1 hypothetical protein N788_00865 [Arenimonas donghaensis DSM 18148 = HO3-R19]
MQIRALMLLWVVALAGCQPSGQAGGESDPARKAAEAAEAAERAQLETLASQIAADRDAVAGFEVLHAGYGHGPDPRSGQSVPTIKVALANGSPVTVTRVSLHVRLANEGGGAPWLDQVFDVPLSAPLAPGAGDAVTMTPTGDSDWALKAPPEGVPVRVRVQALALRTPEGRELLTEHAMDDLQRERLDALRAASR